MRIMSAFLWVLGTFVASKIVGNFIFEMLNPPGTGVNLATAFIPALFSAVIVGFGFYKAFSAFKKGGESEVTSSNEGASSSDKFKQAIKTSMEDAYSTVVNVAKNNTSAPQSTKPVLPSDEKLWEIALEELEGDLRKKGLWAKCFSDSGGDENKAKASYLKMRVAELKTIGVDLEPLIKKEEPKIFTSSSIQNSISCPKCSTSNLKDRHICISCGWDLYKLENSAINEDVLKNNVGVISCPKCSTTNLRTRNSCVSCNYKF